MFQIKVERSSDPILPSLVSNPGEVFGRPFGGYLLFLFGEADAEIATWFARHLVSIDSLTGEDIACAILARRIRVRSHGEYAESPRPRFSIRKTQNDDVYLKNISREPGMAFGRARRLVEEGESLWSGSTREITAVTPAADEVARSLGVLDHLPCMVVIDGIPQREQCIVPLAPEHLHELVPILRRVVQRLRCQPTFSRYLENIQTANSLAEQLQQQDWSLARGRQSLVDCETQYQLEQEVIRSAFLEVRRRVEEGSPRLLAAALRRIPNLDAARADQVLGEVRRVQRDLQRLSRTIGTLQYHGASREAVDREQAKLKRLYQSHVQPLLSESLPPPDLVIQETCNGWVREMEKLQADMIGRLLALLPTEEELIEQLRQRVGPELERAREALTTGRQRLEATRSRISSLTAACIAPDHPSLTAVFQEVGPRAGLDMFRSAGIGGQRLVDSHPLVKHADVEYRLQGRCTPCAPTAKSSGFDVFLCHNSADKTAVRSIAHQMRAVGLRPWFDEWELRPGLPWQTALEEQVRQAQAAAVFLGGSGPGPWQQLEVDALLRGFVRSHRPVIPVLLPSLVGEPTLPLFLEGMMWVDYRRTAPDPLSQLLWGITGSR
ncbi:toll/interleukin-1 receptor domain-containing protein [Corallococcus carmarthensis]|uniref:TIR domain-containing protein n=1 Tax=Corallococcus carmarthensis TaxID=2316728 RepID=A0A3A8KYR2_9BACT|nr:toll/interleukin-1 receptor domain-containing protein [Corallococcus carmarthensis]NOK15826.1 TIR domain-containing protein [Corallococcus carmarthensis]RKH07452.1 TIR domain-containing protein [Corallococcus carmarthensis]